VDGECKRAGISGLTFHDLRRECATRWLRSGVPLPDISYLLGHAKVTTTAIYIGMNEHASGKALREVHAKTRKHYPNLTQRPNGDPPGVSKPLQTKSRKRAVLRAVS
jgi:integrase